MAITIALIDSTPHHLRYLATADGVISSPPVTADAQALIGNSGAASPDLRTDIQEVGHAHGATGLPLRAPIRANVDGYGPIAAGAVTQNAARAIFMLDDTGYTGIQGDELVTRCLVTVVSRSGTPGLWYVDIQQDTYDDSPPGSVGNPTIIVGCVAGVVTTAIVHVQALHTIVQ